MIRFEKTCARFPEQYNIYINEEKIGYIHLRHGILNVIKDDEIIYSYHFNDTWKGEFSNENERTFYLNKIRKLLMEKEKEYEQFNLWNTR